MAEYVDPTAALRAPVAAAETPEQAQARQLQEQIAALNAAPVVQEMIEADEEPAADALPELEKVELPKPGRKAASRPVPEAELSPEQKQIRQLQDQLARAQARKLDSDTAEEYESLGDGELVEFYVVVDGWTAWGHVWYRGQEFAVEVGSRAWDDTLDRNGQSYLRYVYDEFAQSQAYGEVMIRKGRWPGKKYADGRAQAAEDRRARAAPVLTLGA